MGRFKIHPSDDPLHENVGVNYKKMLHCQKVCLLLFQVADQEALISSFLMGQSTASTAASGILLRPKLLFLYTKKNGINMLTSNSWLEATGRGMCPYSSYICRFPGMDSGSPSVNRVLFCGKEIHHNTHILLSQVTKANFLRCDKGMLLPWDGRDTPPGRHVRFFSAQATRDSDTISYMSDLLTRAVANVVPKKLAEEKLQKKIRMYWGIDPTGARIHLGHAVPLRKMQKFAEEGHEVIMLIGSFTAMIGDPTGRDKMREPLTKEQIQQNFETYKEQASNVLDFSKVQIRYNHEWLEKLGFAEIVELASQFTVQQMLERDMFEKRMKEGKPISMVEFFYPLMVGYDSVVLDVDCELGGSDQEFNMLAGRTLQKAMGKRDKFVLTTKLLEGTDGRKMSKTYDNCIYLDDKPNDMYGKVMRVNDDLMAQYFECCTDVPMKEVESMEKEMKKGTNPKEFKMRLAREIVTLYHGKSAAESAEKEFQSVFSDKQQPTDMPTLKAKKGSLLLDVLLEHKLIASKSEGRRLIEQGGITFNDQPVTSPDLKVGEGLTPEDMAQGVVVKVGKRKFGKISAI